MFDSCVLNIGARFFLKKLAGDYDPTNKVMARRVIFESAARGEFATGLIYVEPGRPDFLALLNVVDEPLASLPPEKVRPPREALDAIMDALQ